MGNPLLAAKTALRNIPLFNAGAEALGLGLDYAFDTQPKGNQWGDWLTEVMGVGMINPLLTSYQLGETGSQGIVEGKNKYGYTQQEMDALLSAMTPSQLYSFRAGDKGKYLDEFATKHPYLLKEDSAMSDIFTGDSNLLQVGNSNINRPAEDKPIMSTPWSFLRGKDKEYEDKRNAYKAAQLAAMNAVGKLDDRGRYRNEESGEIMGDSTGITNDRYIQAWKNQLPEAPVNNVDRSGERAIWKSNKEYKPLLTQDMLKNFELKRNGGVMNTNKLPKFLTGGPFDIASKTKYQLTKPDTSIFGLNRPTGIDTTLNVPNEIEMPNSQFELNIPKINSKPETSKRVAIGKDKNGNVIYAGTDAKGKRTRYTIDPVTGEPKYVIDTNTQGDGDGLGSNINGRDIAAVALGLGPAVTGMIQSNKLLDKYGDFEAEPHLVNAPVGAVRDLAKPSFAMKYRTPGTVGSQESEANRNFAYAQQEAGERNYELENDKSKLGQEIAIRNAIGQQAGMNAQILNQNEAQTSQQHAALAGFAEDNKKKATIAAFNTLSKINEQGGWKNDSKDLLALEMAIKSDDPKIREAAKLKLRKMMGLT